MDKMIYWVRPKKVVAKCKIDIKNIENWFGGEKNGGERNPLARTTLLATLSSGLQTPARNALAWLRGKHSLSNSRFCRRQHG